MLDTENKKEELSKTCAMEIDGKTIHVRTGRMAKQASGAVEITCGDTMLLVTCTESREPREGIDFFPLLVDYEEKLYAVGRVPGSFLRREGRASDKAILTSRLIDRPIRPLFKKGYRKDVQVVATAMSADQENPTDTLAMLDVLAEKMPLPRAAPGDLVVVFQSGAYGLSASPQDFLSHSRTLEVLV